jgi:hypothetical protein
MRSEEEITEQLGEAQNTIVENEGEGRATKWRAATYEQGVENALLWVLEHQDNKPMED